jgi:hypothetical protein
MRVLWDAPRELPLNGTARSANGNASNTTTVKLVESRTKQPWDVAAKFTIKGYSDLLD